MAPGAGAGAGDGESFYAVARRTPLWRVYCILLLYSLGECELMRVSRLREMALGAGPARRGLAAAMAAIVMAASHEWGWWDFIG